MQSLTVISGPSRMHMCSCGHRATQHPSTGERPCVARECHCETYDRVPLPRCATCHHPSVLHHSKTPQNLWADSGHEKLPGDGHEAARWRT